MIAILNYDDQIDDVIDSVNTLLAKKGLYIGYKDNSKDGEIKIKLKKIPEVKKTNDIVECGTMSFIQLYEANNNIPKINLDKEYQE